MTEFEKWLKDNHIGRHVIGGLNPFGGQHLDEMPPAELRRLVECDFRWQAIRRFSFAVLAQATVDLLKSHGPFLECGSGTCYWAWELGRVGVDIVATDPKPYSDIAKRMKPTRRWLNSEPLTGVQAVKKHPGRTLLLVWPSYDVSWPVEALRKFMAAGGKKLVYVGEGAGGCCADDAFFELLDRKWQKSESFTIPQWMGIHDGGSIWTKK